MWAKIKTGFIWVLILVVLSSSLSSCGGGATADIRRDAETFNKLNHKFNEELQDTWLGIYRLLSIATNDFEANLENSGYVMMDESVSRQFNKELPKVLQSSARSLLTAYEMVEVSDHLGSLLTYMPQKSNVAYAATKRPPQPALERSNIAITLTFFVAAVALTAYGGYKSLCAIVDAGGGDTARKAIRIAIDEELKLINEKLGISKDKKRVEALKKFNELGLRDKTNVAAEIKKINLEHSKSVANDAIEDFAHAAGKAGEEGLKFYVDTLTEGANVGEITKATGGQAKLANWLGEPAAEIVVGTVDLGVSAAGMQPGEQLSKHIDLIMTSKRQRKVTIAASDLSITEAVNTVKEVADGKLNNIKSIEKLKGSGHKIAAEIAKQAPAELGTEVNPDGSLTVNVPEITTVTMIDKPIVGQPYAVMAPLYIGFGAEAEPGKEGTVKQAVAEGVTAYILAAVWDKVVELKRDVNLAEYKMVELGGVDIKKASDEEILTSIILTLGSAGTREEALKAALRILQKEPPEGKPEPKPPAPEEEEVAVAKVCGTWQMTTISFCIHEGELRYGEIRGEDIREERKPRTWEISESSGGLKLVVDGLDAEFWYIRDMMVQTGKAFGYTIKQHGKGYLRDSGRSFVYSCEIAGNKVDIETGNILEETFTAQVVWKGKASDDRLDASMIMGDPRTPQNYGINEYEGRRK